MITCLLAACAVWGQVPVPEPDSASVAAILQQWLKKDYDERLRPDALSLDRYTFLAEQKGWTSLEIALNRELGVFYRETGQPDAARFWFQRFYKQNIEKQDSLGIALALTHLGNNCIAQGDHQNALEYNQAALGIRLRHQQEEDPVKLANSWMFVGLSFARLGKYEQAATHYWKSLDVRLHKTDSAGYALLMANMASLEFFRGNEVLGNQYYFNSIHFRNKGLSPCNWMTYYLARAEALNQFGRYAQALPLLDSCLLLLDACPRPRKKADALFEKGLVLLEKKHFEAAEQEISAAVDILKKWGAYHRIAEMYRAYFQHALKNGYAPKAEEYFNLYEVYKDSMMVRQSERSLSRLQIQEEMQRKTEDIRHLNQQKDERTRQRNFLLLGFLIALLVIAGIYILNRVRKLAFLRVREQKRAAEQLLQEKVQLLADLHAAQQQLVQHEKMAALGQLTAGIAHELNNPLNFILNNTEALRLDYEEWKQKHGPATPEIEALEKEIQQLIDDIGHGGMRMRNIVQELSQFSRTDTEASENIALPDIISEAIHLLQIRGNRWPVILDLPKQLPMLIGHSGKLVQLFSNLLSNAFDALESRWADHPEHGRLTLSAEVEGQEIIISIADNGTGMTEEIARKLFDPFFTTKPVGKGTGLGLSIAFAIVKAHRGRIEAHGAPGEGATFIVALPLNSDALHHHPIKNQGGR